MGTLVFDILTIFPGLMDSPLNESIIRRARQDNKIRVDITDIRDFTLDTGARGQEQWSLASLFSDQTNGRLE